MTYYAKDQTCGNVTAFLSISVIFLYFLTGDAAQICCTLASKMQTETSGVCHIAPVLKDPTHTRVAPPSKMLLMLMLLQGHGSSTRVYIGGVRDVSGQRKSPIFSSLQVSVLETFVA